MMKKRRGQAPKTLSLVAILLVSSGKQALAHSGQHHDTDKADEQPPHSTTEPAPELDEQEKKLVEITADYQMIVAPLVQRACTDCHSGDTRYPWYAMLPGIKQWIKKDIEEARQHIELSNGYPFQSHATPLEDLKAVEQVIKDGSMPPLRYRMLHPQARLDKQEKQRIVDWAQRGQQLLRKDVAGD